MTRTVLAVDDDAGIRELLKFRLKKSGFAVTACKNGRECIEHLRAESLPSVVLLDVRMPQMGGIAVLETIREEFAADLPVVLLTGTRSEDDADTRGATARIEKPFRMDEVVACIERVLDE